MSTGAEEFLVEMLPKQEAAERAIHNGDVEPRLALWSRHDPVTLYGARLAASGWADLEPTFREVASWFADSVAYEFEVVAAGASGDLAYTVGYEHNNVSVDGKPTTYTLRVTHVYRREDGQWRIVHRHADVPPTGDGAVTFPPPAAATAGAPADEKSPT
jgi:ketosteroid isomerase-like protein